MVTAKKKLKSFSQTKLPNNQSTMFHSRLDSFSVVPRHHMILIHELGGFRGLTTNIVIAFEKHFTRFMNFFIQELHELFGVLIGFHCQRGEDNCNGANITAPIFKLSKSVDVGQIYCAASHSRHPGALVIFIVSCSVRPITISVIRI